MNPDGVTGTGPVLLTATSTNWIKYTYNCCFDTLDNKQQMAVIPERREISQVSPKLSQTFRVETLSGLRTFSGLESKENMKVSQ